MNSLSSESKETAIHTSFIGLFGRSVSGLQINEIEIPLIQRDYAQGREYESVRLIRTKFIDALYTALQSGAHPIDLDFVFGDVDENGKFFPLDGQQRLTTLFLLHCYLAWRVEDAESVQSQPWHAFSYATRPGARAFCHFLVKCQPDMSAGLSDYLIDHADYLPTWKHDPTIQSMLVVLDAIHARFSDKAHNELHASWLRLTDDSNPAIQFYLLPMKSNRLTDTLYIKMNSRGKPLTEFENFKANFEDVLNKYHKVKVEEFSRKIDSEWSDILWVYRGDNALIDEEFMRYFRYLTEVLAWKNNIIFRETVKDDDLAEKVYGSNQPESAINIALLIQYFDVWNGKCIKDDFQKMFTRQDADHSSKLRVFNFNKFDDKLIGVDIFHACCIHYGSGHWSFPHTLLFYGVIIGFNEEIAGAELAIRLRLLRNLIEASGSDIIRAENMPKLLGEVEQIVLHKDITQVFTFNQVQIENEKAKAIFLEAHPGLEGDLYKLEDHELLRGGLTVFDLDPAQSEHQFLLRAEEFGKLFDNPYPMITGALLAKGDYARWESRWTGHRLADFGAPKNDEPWQKLFKGMKKDNGVHPSSIALMSLLDDLANGKTIQDVIDDYLGDPSTVMDWRYYLVKYKMMREGASGRYSFSSTGYQSCMLEVWQFNSNYRDPFLLAIFSVSKLDASCISTLYFFGLEKEPRYLVLKKSGLRIQCADEGWLFDVSSLDSMQRANFEKVSSNFDFVNDIFVVSQQQGVDTADRIELGARILRELVSVGL